MKLKTTKKAINASGKKVLKVGYCDLQYLLSEKEVFAYSTRKEGLACDYYEFDNCIISTGYSPIGEKVDYNLIKEYDKKAQDLKYSDIKYNEKVMQLKVLINHFLKKVGV